MFAEKKLPVRRPFLSWMPGVAIVLLAVRKIGIRRLQDFAPETSPGILNR